MASMKNYFFCKAPERPKYCEQPELNPCCCNCDKHKKCHRRAVNQMIPCKLSDFEEGEICDYAK